MLVLNCGFWNLPIFTNLNWLNCCTRISHTSTSTTDSIHNFPKISVWSIPPPSLTTPVSSKLPSPPRKSPEYQVSDDSYEPIEPPKRRRLLSNKESKKSKTKMTQRPASTSSTWTPWIRYEERFRSFFLKIYF